MAAAPAAVTDPVPVPEADDRWYPGWVLASGVFGLLAGPLMMVVPNSVREGSFPSGCLGLGVIAACVGTLYRVGRRWRGWDRRPSLLRSVAVLAVGAVLWVLPSAWSIPDSVLAAPLAWLALTVPFVLAALAVSPNAWRFARIGAVAVLAAVAVLWPTFCAMAVTEVRHTSGIPADAWFVTRLEGYKIDSYSSAPGGVTAISYVSTQNEVPEETYDLVLTSWPAAGSPCSRYVGAPSCTANADGTWSVADRHDGTVLIVRRGARYLAAEVWPDSMVHIAPARLPAILAAVHIAGGHEILKIADGS